MADINIAAPGGSEAALKAALGLLTAWVQIDSGVISSPIAFFDVALPSGYMAFRLEMSGITFNDVTGQVGDSLNFSLSHDAGSTFFNGSDAYRSQIFYAFDNDGYTSLASTWLDTLGYLSAISLDSASFNSPFMTRIEISQGSATTYPITRSDFVHGGGTSDALSIGTVVSQLKTLGASNLMRVQPYGNGDTAPPTSANRIHSGIWTLKGTLSP